MYGRMHAGMYVCTYLVTYFKVRRREVSLISMLYCSLVSALCLCARGERERAMSLVLACLPSYSCCSLLLAPSLPGPCLSTGTGTRAWYGVPGYLTCQGGAPNWFRAEW